MVSGVNGVLLANDSEVSAVVAGSFYNNKIPYLERLRLFNKLRAAAGSGEESEVMSVNHRDLMHIRKVKFQI